MRAKRSPVPLIIIAEMVKVTWNERNGIRYRGTRSQLPIRHVLGLAVRQVKALLVNCMSNKKRRLWESELKILEVAAKPPVLANPQYVVS